MHKNAYLSLGLFSTLSAQRPSSVYHDAVAIAEYLSRDFPARLSLRDVSRGAGGRFLGLKNVYGYYQAGNWRLRTDIRANEEYVFKTGDRLMYLPDQYERADSITCTATRR